MAQEQPTVEGLLPYAGVAATIDLIVETAKQVGISTNMQLAPLMEEGINVEGRERKDTLLKCEDKIREQVAEVFGKEIKNRVLDKKFCASKLEKYPSSYTGVFLYYLCKGLYEDFGIWFDGVPVALKNRTTASKETVAYESGGRVISNKNAKELIKMADMKYYADRIASGNMTIDMASKAVVQAYQEIQRYQSMGIILPTKATEKVRYFDEEVEARADKSKPDSRFNIFKANGLEITVPRLQEQYKVKCTGHRKYATSVKNLKGAIYFPNVSNTADDDGTVLCKDVFNEIDRLVAMAKEEVGAVGKDFKIINMHIVKKQGSGRMRLVVFDCESPKKGQFLLHTDCFDLVGIIDG